MTISIEARGPEAPRPTNLRDTRVACRLHMRLNQCSFELTFRTPAAAGADRGGPAHRAPAAFDRSNPPTPPGPAEPQANRPPPLPMANRPPRVGASPPPLPPRAAVAALNRPPAPAATPRWPPRVGASPPPLPPPRAAVTASNQPLAPATPAMPPRVEASPPPPPPPRASNQPPAPAATPAMPPAPAVAASNRPPAPAATAELPFAPWTPELHSLAIDFFYVISRALVAELHLRVRIICARTSRSNRSTKCSSVWR